jgi:hypothetical protein
VNFSAGVPVTMTVTGTCNGNAPPSAGNITVQYRAR